MRFKSEHFLAASGRIFFFTCLTIFYIINVLFVFYSLNSLHDFGSFVAAGQLSRNGENPYSDQSPLIFSAYFPGIDHYGIAPNLNPPISVLAFEVLAGIPPEKAVAIWRIFSIILFIVAVAILQYQLHRFVNPSIKWRIVWAFGTAGLWHTIQLGQIYTLMLVLATATWVCSKQNKAILGGITLGILIAIKPNFIIWALILAVAGYRMIFWTASGVATGISLIPLFYHGTDIYLQWLDASLKYAPNLLIFPANNSFQGLTARFDLPQAGSIAGIALAMFVLVFVAKQRLPVSKNNSLGIIVSLLASPIAWTGYTLLIMPILFDEEIWDWKYWLSAFIFMVPFYFPLILFQDSFFNFVVFGWFYGWGILLVLNKLFAAHDHKQE